MIVDILVHKESLEGIEAVCMFQVTWDEGICSYSYQMRTTEYCVNVYD